jgi:hypothetical protein
MPMFAPPPMFAIGPCRAAAHLNIHGALALPHMPASRQPRVAAGFSSLSVVMQGWGDYQPREARRGGGGGGWGGPDNNLGRNRPGDWECPECGAAVFGSKDLCYRCSCPKPANARAAAGRGRERGSRGSGGGRWGGGERDRGRGRGKREMGPWTRAQDDGAEVDAAMVLNMMHARDDARAGRDFATADDIRSVLAEDWSVYLDDDLREWWVGEPRERERGQGDRPVGPWKRAVEDTAEVDEDAVMGLVKARDEARALRDFATADQVRDSLQMEHGVAVDDRLRQWWVGERTDKGRNGRLGGGASAAPWTRSREEEGEEEGDSGAAEVNEEALMAILAQRDEARSDRDYAKADALRDEVLGFRV